MKKNIILASLIIIALCSACNTEDSINPNVNKENPAETPDTAWIEDVKEEDIFNAESTIREDIDLGEQQQKISQKINELSWDTFSKIFSNKEDVSLLVSPLSLNQNIMMLSNGLKGETREEILKAFGISDFSLEEINSYILQLNEGLNGADSRTKYRTNNAIWHANSMTIQQEFKENISGVYETDIFPAMMNYQTLDSINAWANEKTFGRIKNMVDYLNPATKAVMMNTVYFRGLWTEELPDKQINDGNFTNENGETEQARMVSYPKVSLYAEGETYQTTVRHFGNEAFAMDFILPKEGVNAFDALTEFISTKGYGAEHKRVNLKFPIFESATEMKLNELLVSLGINRIFGNASPDEICLFDTPVFVSSVIQKTSISVDEKGTEAAAGTYEIMYGNTGEEIKETEMTLNRPFFYTIRETSTNTPLFIGYQGSVKK
jgi:serpin B